MVQLLQMFLYRILQECMNQKCMTLKKEYFLHILLLSLSHTRIKFACRLEFLSRWTQMMPSIPLSLIFHQYFQYQRNFIIDHLSCRMKKSNFLLLTYYTNMLWKVAQLRKLIYYSWVYSSLKFHQHSQEYLFIYKSQKKWNYWLMYTRKDLMKHNQRRQTRTTMQNHINVRSYLNLNFSTLSFFYGHK